MVRLKGKTTEQLLFRHKKRTRFFPIIYLHELKVCTISFPFSAEESEILLNFKTAEVSKIREKYVLGPPINACYREGPEFEFNNFWNILEIRLLLSCFEIGQLSSAATKKVIANNSLRSEILDAFAEWYSRDEKGILINHGQVTSGIQYIVSNDVACDCLREVSQQVSNLLFNCFYHLYTMIDEI